MDFLIDSTVMLVEEDGAGGFDPSCSGVWISDDQILTAYHCIDDAGMTPLDEMVHDMFGLDWDPVGKPVPYMTPRFMAGKSIDKMKEARSAKVVKVDKKKDLALLVAKGDLSHSYAELSARVSAGMAVHTVGCTAGLPWSYSPGWVGAVRDMETMHGRSIVVQVVGGAWRGNSGGGVFDGAGRLLGVTSFLANGTILTFHIAASEVEKFLGK